MEGRSPEQGRGHEEWFLLSGKELCASPAPLKTPSAFRDPSGSLGLFQTIPPSQNYSHTKRWLFSARVQWSFPEGHIRRGDVMASMAYGMCAYSSTFQKYALVFHVCLCCMVIYTYINQNEMKYSFSLTRHMWPVAVTLDSANVQMFLPHRKFSWTVLIGGKCEWAQSNKYMSFSYLNTF